MKQLIMDFLIAYGIQALVAVLGGIFLYFVGKAKGEKVKTIREIVNKVFVLVEQKIPDDTPNKTALKIDKALKLFNAMYKEIFDDTPPQSVIEFAQEIWQVTASQVKLLKLDK